ncbi:MAG TPA: TolC family protein [Bryobacteraceae bacterium]|nr:TolC family protein [Bryobacteraceae bacterium]
MRRRWLLLASVTLCPTLTAQAPPVVSLDQAQQIALGNHPKIAAVALTAQASGFQVKEARSAYFPTLSVNVTGVGTEHGSVLSAGAVTTSSIYSRQSTGVVLNQLITDFGRTADLIKSAKLRNESENQNVTNTRAQVLVSVQQAYYRALAAQSVLKVAQATLSLRRVTLRQVTALAQSALRSTVDVSFAQVNESQAELDLLRAENDAIASHSELSAAMGYDHDQPFSLNDEPLPAALNPNVDALIQEANRERPDLAALRLNQKALDRYADAEKDLRNPTISLGAVAGVAPVRDPRLPESYSGAGVNISIPVLNGGLFKARREEAEARAAAAAKDVQDLSVQVARDVRVAWLNANDAFRRLDVTARMEAQANESLRLAQARYDAALGSIVELNTAQLNQTASQIAAASAKYDYLSARAALNYTMGLLR